MATYYLYYEDHDGEFNCSYELKGDVLDWRGTHIVFKDTDDIEMIIPWGRIYHLIKIEEKPEKEIKKPILLKVKKDLQ